MLVSSNLLAAPLPLQPHKVDKTRLVVPSNLPTRSRVRGPCVVMIRVASCWVVTLKLPLHYVAFTTFAWSWYLLHHVSTDLLASGTSGTMLGGCMKSPYYSCTLTLSWRG